MHENIVDNAQELIELINNSPRVYIYGAGFIAEFFYSIIKVMGAASRVEAFIVSSGKTDYIDGIKVITLKDYEDTEGALICIAVHEASLPEIEENLAVNKISKYVWIYPYLYEMWLGKPIETDIRIPIKKIWDCLPDRYVVAVRYLVIDQYYGNNLIGYDLYKKALVLPKTPETTEKRFSNFLRLIDNVNKSGFDNSKRIRVRDDYSIIDGYHRFTTALYHRYKTISADVYTIQNKLNIDMIPEGKRLCRDNLHTFGFTPCEIKLLDDVIDIIDKSFHG